MRVIINGLPLFSDRLAKDLSKIEPEASFVFFDTYSSRLDQLKYLLHVPFADVVISMNGVTDDSGSLNWAMKWKKKLVLQWMGTDALLAIARQKNGTILRKYIDYGVNFTDSSWLKREVESIGVEAREVGFKYAKSVQLTQKYKQISMVTYVSGARRDFYGFERIKLLANAFPEVPIHVYGMDDPKEQGIENMIFYGWTPEKEFQDALKNSPIFIRLTEHDGFSVSVIEALERGCEVFWTFPFENTFQIFSDDAFHQQMREVIESIKGREMQPNNDKRQFILDRLDKKKVLENYVAALKKYLE